jgi:alanine-glyoxylate transaminase/serine-glyoxylate transaminase/serine-pyruvate transaminase
MGFNSRPESVDKLIAALGTMISNN